MLRTRRCTWRTARICWCNVLGAQWGCVSRWSKPQSRLLATVLWRSHLAIKPLRSQVPRQTHGLELGSELVQLRLVGWIDDGRAPKSIKPLRVIVTLCRAGSRRAVRGASCHGVSQPSLRKAFLCMHGENSMYAMSIRS